RRSRPSSARSRSRWGSAPTGHRGGRSAWSSSAGCWSRSSSRSTSRRSSTSIWRNSRRKCSTAPPSSTRATWSRRRSNGGRVRRGFSESDRPQMRGMRKLLVAVLLPSLAAGCAVGPNYKRPDLSVPEKARGQVGPAEAASLADQPWWEIFKDSTLQQLVDEALKTGYDVRLAAARVEEARAVAGIARSDFYPQINYSAQFSRSKDSEYFTPGARPVNLHDVNLGMTWEIDLWGRIRRSSEAALANYYATEDARRGVLL